MALALAALSASLASAQQAPAEPVASPEGERKTSKLEAVTVTVQRIRQNLQDVPASVTAFTSGAMENHQIQSATDLSRLVPNVKFDTVTGGSTGLRPFIRGGGITDGGQITSESEVGIYVDDVYRARLSGALMEFIELDRIEVLRGPQGVLYGRNSSAGALSIVTRAPSPTFTASTELGIGSNGLKRIKGYVSSALSDDKRWRGSLQGMFSSRDGNGQFNVTQNKRVGGEDFTGAQADLAYEGPVLKARFSAFTTHTDGDGQWAVPNTVSADGLTITPSTGSYRKVASPTDSLTDVKQTGQTLRLSTDLGGVRLVSITGHVRMDDHWRQDFSGGVSAALIGGAAGTTLALFERDSVTRHRQFSQELQASGELLDGRLSYIGGLYYFDESGSQDIATFIFFTPSTVRFNADTRSRAVFGQLSGKLGENTTVQLGGRYSRDDKRLDGAMSGSPFDATHRFSKFTPRIGIDHKLVPGMLLYASYSQGFKAGGYNGLASTVAQIREPFLPQTTDAYELGVKADLLDRTLRLNVSLFHNKIQNRQQTLTVASGPSAGSFVVENYNATLNGLEAEATWRVGAGLTLWANGALNRSKYTACATAVALPCSVIDNTLPVVPRHAVTVGFDHEMALGRGQLTYGADYSERASFFSTADNALIGAVPRQKFLNAYVTYSLDAWSLQLAGKNLLQQEGWQTGFGFSVVQPRYAIPGRTLQLNLRYQY
ncbi:TonB-dependent receptor [Roseateles sp. LKC17W]|uniref:TonB-dependent receptor n=1 Tax=Pelomonas margarita TaxID=3299031 RepID=A0ABW7FJN2_9BURK